MFEKSQNQLREIFKSCGFENCQKRTDKSYKLRDGQVNQEDISEIVQNEREESVTVDKLLAGKH